MPTFMKRLYPLTISLILLAACSSSKQQEQNDVKAQNLTSQNVAENNTSKEAKKQNTQKKSAKPKEITQLPKEKKLSLVQTLLAGLGKGAKVEYVEMDKEILHNDTLVNTKSGKYKISYATACLNDSLVAQEMFNYGDSYNKTYRLLHNYETSIAMQHNGQPSGSKIISKDIFKNKMERAFLEKAIIKHPQFVRFDEEKNEAVFQFIVGIPSTDWVVLAAINLSPRGDIRIIDIAMPKFDQR